jgi:hypothetical protein
MRTKTYTEELTKIIDVFAEIEGINLDTMSGTAKHRLNEIINTIYENGFHAGYEKAREMLAYINSKRV